MIEYKKKTGGLKRLIRSLLKVYTGYPVLINNAGGSFMRTYRPCLWCRVWQKDPHIVQPRLASTAAAWARMTLSDTFGGAGPRTVTTYSTSATRLLSELW